MSGLGIDFGTTRTVVAAQDRGNYPVVGFTGPDGSTLDWYPTLVAERGGELLYGLDAAQAAGNADVVLVRSFKRLLSRPDVSPSTPLRVGRLELPILDIVTGFLSALRRDILERSNLPAGLGSKSRPRTVVATPANAHSAQRFITLESFRRAGFDVVAMLNEPSAAGVEYAHRYRNTITARREHILVYDLGGGTFDASLVRMSGRAHDVVASSGLARLGGDDFDAVLASMALETRGGSLAALDERARTLLLEQCREVKERIHPNSKRVAIDLGACGERRVGDDPVSVPIEAFYARCTPLVAETIATMKRVLHGGSDEVVLNQRPEEALPVLDSSDVAGIYVVGGASALPVIARILKEEFGRRVHRSVYPSAATAIGLAIALDDQAGFHVTERFSHHFGVFREALSGRAVAFDPIFTEATEQPSRAGEATVLIRKYRAAHNIGHFRYIECGWLDGHGAPGGDITPFAEVLFPFDPALRRPGIDLAAVPVQRREDEGPLVEERYAVRSGGVVELTIVDLDTGYQRHLQLGESTLQ